MYINGWHSPGQTVVMYTQGQMERPGFHPHSTTPTCPLCSHQGGGQLINIGELSATDTHHMRFVLQRALQATQPRIAAALSPAAAPTRYGSQAVALLRACTASRIASTSPSIRCSLQACKRASFLSRSPPECTTELHPHLSSMQVRTALQGPLG